MSNLLFLRRSYAYRHAATAVFRNAHALPVEPEREMARVVAGGPWDLARTEAGRATGRVVPECAPILPASEHDMSDRRSRKTSEQIYDADQFIRCAACWCWFDRSNSVSAAAHRGRLPHPTIKLRTAWADEDE
jgi:hypothetical protein